jgi:hypothetical protein
MLGQNLRNNLQKSINKLFDSLAMTNYNVLPFFKKMELLSIYVYARLLIVSIYIYIYIY